MSTVINSLPSADGFSMPGEFASHHGCLMIWPVRPGSWLFGGAAARKVFAQAAEAIAESETLYMMTDPEHLEEARSMLSERIHILPFRTDDAWARDVGPTFLINEKKEIRGVDWAFNAWGGEVDGLYQNWQQDDQAASAFCRYLNVDRYDAHPFVLEGGAIHSDGEGTVLVTEACLLSKGRNPSLTKEQIEGKLKDYLGAEKVIWLPHGIWQDETNEHVDNVCAFTKPGEVVLAWTDDEKDPQYGYSAADLKVLEKERDARGRKLVVHKLPIPARPVCVTAKDLPGYQYEEGEDEREEGERLAASYVNYYVANGSVIVPQFDDVNDKKAVEILGGLYPDRKIVPLYARDILLGGGNIHCITQQIPGKAGETV